MHAVAGRWQWGPPSPDAGPCALHPCMCSHAGTLFSSTAHPVLKQWLRACERACADLRESPRGDQCAAASGTASPWLLQRMAGVGCVVGLVGLLLEAGASSTRCRPPTWRSMRNTPTLLQQTGTSTMPRLSTSTSCHCTAAQCHATSNASSHASCSGLMVGYGSQCVLAAARSSHVAHACAWVWRDPMRTELQCGTCTALH
jgi:hypothetical protein